MVVGIMLSQNKEISEKCISKMRSSLIWITTECLVDDYDGSHLVILKELICCGYKYRVKSHIFIYDDLLQGEILTINQKEAI